MSDENYDHFLQKDEWSFREIVRFFELDSQSIDIFQSGLGYGAIECRHEKKLMQSRAFNLDDDGSIGVREITLYFIKPVDAIAYCLAKKILVPDRVMDFYNGLSKRDKPAPPKNLTKLAQQQNAILAVIAIKGFDPMAIPDGEKVTIQAICDADYPTLFGVSSFKRAWDIGKGKLWLMSSHESHSRRGKQ